MPSTSMSNGSLFGKNKKRLGGRAEGANTPSIPAVKDAIGGSQATASTSVPTGGLPTASKKSRRQSSSISSLSEIRSNLRRRSASFRSPNDFKTATAGALAHQHNEHKDASSLSDTLLHQVRTAPSERSVNQDLSEPSNDSRRNRPSSAADSRGARSLPVLKGQKPESSTKSPLRLQAPYEMNEYYPHVASATAAPAIGSSNPNVLFQRIHDLIAKRISTLAYLRKSHTGQVFWLNVLRYRKADLHKMSYFDPSKLGRRATGFLLLGLSVPALLETKANHVSELLRNWNTLLSEFESYQTIHPPEGTPTTALSRMRVPGMFKRAPNAKPRRGSSAEAFSPPATTEPTEYRSVSGGQILTNSSPIALLSGADRDLLPGEEYQLLLTPSLPFEPDYFETFCILCDVLIDCYLKVADLVKAPDDCSSGTADLFAKADAKVRKLLIAGLVRDFEDCTKQTARSELAGVGKVVLGGLM